ncbi:hypothetical protein Y032_0089g2286 [Ancylostoma ceylanicum]|uniref:Uncharacterized protein n=1 Tax=Ancylostoma ceylanicum TaxID=53326 RepID=A0A016TMK5_9BILA|nr:hypothetical protein Y032_0089g2286 [Ancylostoma ceylanicum]
MSSYTFYYELPRPLNSALPRNDIAKGSKPAINTAAMKISMHSFPRNKFTHSNDDTPEKPTLHKKSLLILSYLRTLLRHGHFQGFVNFKKPWRQNDDNHSSTFRFAKKERSAVPLIPHCPSSFDPHIASLLCIIALEQK